MVTKAKTETRKEKAARRALSRSALYGLLSQAFAYPDAEAVDALRDADLPRAQDAADLSPQIAPLLIAFGEHLLTADAAQLQTDHRRIFTHVLSLDCPPCETVYTARHVFQETQELGDIAGFFRAFGLETGGGERLDHISVELEFMHFLTYKESYALTHHGPAKARLCREAQRKFMQDHLGRWVQRFAQRLGQKAGGGYFGCLSSLTETFISAEIGFLRAKPEPVFVSPDWRTKSNEEFSCPAVGARP